MNARRLDPHIRAVRLLDSLIAAGLDLEPSGDGRVLVRPAAAVTADQREAIVAAKPELLALLIRRLH